MDITRSLGRRKTLLTEDVNTIRATNNAIFNDIFWVHLAYVTADDGIERLRASPASRAPLCARSSPASRRSTKDAVSWRTRRRRRRLDGRPTISSGRATSSSSSTSSARWCNRNFDLLSCAFARLVSIGSATSFEVRGVRQEVAYFTSFYLLLAHPGIPHAVRAQAWPRITRFDDRWRWLVTSVVPRFRRFDADTRLVDASLRRILDEARVFASLPASCRAHPLSV